MCHTTLTHNAEWQRKQNGIKKNLFFSFHILCVVPETNYRPIKPFLSLLYLLSSDFSRFDNFIRTELRIVRTIFNLFSLYCLKSKICFFFSFVFPILLCTTNNTKHATANKTKKNWTEKKTNKTKFLSPICLYSLCV